MTLNILFLSHYFPPEVNAPATRTFEHCRHWVRQGHNVTVLTCFPHHPMGQIYPGYQNKMFQIEMCHGIRVVRLLTLVAANKGIFKRTLNYIFYMVVVIIASPFVGKSDIVISTSPQFFNGLGGYFVSRIKRAYWILEIRDLWPSSIITVGAVKGRLWIRLLERIETFAYRKADFIVAVTHAFKEHIIGRGGSAEKIVVIPNGIDHIGREDQENTKRIMEEFLLKEKFIAAYFGTHGMAHGLEVILEAANFLSAHKNIMFLFAGDGAERKNLEVLCNKKKLKNVQILGQKPKEEMPSLWALADVSLVVLRRLELFKTVVPSKMFEAMAAGVPVLLAVEGEAAEILNAAKCGICIKPEDPRALAEAVLDLSKDPSKCREYGRNGLAYVRKNHSRRKMAERYEKVMIALMQ